MLEGQKRSNFVTKIKKKLSLETYFESIS